jgi:hypothetical protein
MEAVTNFCTINNMIGMFITMVLIPFFLPTIKDGFCNCFIQFNNMKNSRPTFKINEKYVGLVFSNGFVFSACQIMKVDFKTVTFMNHSRECVQIKKSNLVTGKVMPIHSEHILS